VRCQAKLLGTLVTVAGAMFMTLYKGPIVEMLWSKHIHPRKSYVTDTTGTTDKDWFKGSILLIIATLAWASLFVLQVSDDAKMKRRSARVLCFFPPFSFPFMKVINILFVWHDRPKHWRHIRTTSSLSRHLCASLEPYKLLLWHLRWSTRALFGELAGTWTSLLLPML